MLMSKRIRGRLSEKTGKQAGQEAETQSTSIPGGALGTFWPWSCLILRVILEVKSYYLQFKKRKPNSLKNQLVMG